MAENDVNIDLSPELQYVQYSVPEFEIPAQQVIAGTAITNVNGLTGPNITFTGSTSGFSYAPSGVTVVLVSTLTTKGDLYTRDAANGTRLAVGANNARLVADSAQATGLVWIAASTGWNAPSGTLSRGTYAAYAGQMISNPPTQAEVQALDDAVKLMSQTLAAALSDLRTQRIFNT